MYSSQCSLELGNQKYIEVCALNNGEPRIDLREFKQTEKSKFPIKKGISLNLEIFKSLELATDMVDTAMNKNEDLHYHIWGNIFLTVRSDNPCVDIWKYWKPESEVNLVPKKGICLRPTEYVHLKSHVRNLEKKFSQLETIVPCFMRDDHQNQLGMFRWPTYNPLEYENWWKIKGTKFKH